MTLLLPDKRIVVPDNTIVVPTNAPVWKPHPKQAEFLECPDFEVLYGGAAGGGKAFSLQTPIPTPSGWTAMGDLRRDDVIFGERGQQVRITQVYAVDWKPESYRLSFDDGSTIEACADHRWLTLDAAELAALTRRDPQWREQRRNRRAPRAGTKKSAAFRAAIAARNARCPPPALPAPTGTVRTTADIFATQRTARARVNHAIPVAGALDLPTLELSLDPYVLGAWLGDGTAASGGFAGNDPPIWQEIEAAGFVVTHSSAKCVHHIRGLSQKLRPLGLIKNKHIPPHYLRASREQRLALLQGLMDTDGTVCDHGQVEFTNTNRAIIDGVHELVMSLGWKARIIESRAKLYGKDCGPTFDIKWTPDDYVFRLPRKRDKQRLATRRTCRFRYIVKCERIASVPMRCIRVDNPSGLFLAGRQMVPTHNSDGLLMDAWCMQANGPHNKHHRAVIFRKALTDLAALIERARELFPLFIKDIVYNKNAHVFTTPAGATLKFAYCANDSDRFMWRGWAWNYIGFEELTLWATDAVYRYLMSRCRTADRSLPRYVRSTTNPDGPGQKWVMQRFGIEEAGTASLIDTEQEFEELKPGATGESNEDWQYVLRKVRRRFIPAKLVDNPSLRGTGYRETLMDLPPEDREALLKGLWTGNRIKGAWFFKEMQAARAQGRIRMIPHLKGTPVNTFWDLGRNDTTAICFHQYANLQNRFLFGYENSGEYLDHFVAELQRLAIDRGFVYGKHYLPHDAEQKKLQANSGMGPSVLTQLRALMPGAKFVVVPRIDHLFNGNQLTRAAIATCWFDPDDCSDLIAALDAYRKKWDSKNEVFTEEEVHDRFSNYASAFRQFAQGYYTPRANTRAGSGKRRSSDRSEGHMSV